MTAIDEIKNRVYKTTQPDDRRIKGIWDVDCLYNPKDNGRVFNYNFIISQTIGQGCAYSTKKNDGIGYINIMGKDFLDVDIKDPALLVSMLDSIYGCFYCLEPTKSETINADSETKMQWRTNIIYKEAVRLLGDLRDKKILNVGVVGDIIKKFVHEDCEITGTDFDKTIIGQKMFGRAEIYDGDKTLDLISRNDLAIVTGMTITTQTIDDIIRCCKESNTKIIIYAETGANLSQYFIELGVDSFISEIFPFYIFNGVSTINTYNK